MSVTCSGHLWPSPATSWSHTSWAGSCQEWEEPVRKEKVWNCHRSHKSIQNTLNAASRLTTAELVLPFSQGESQQPQPCWPPLTALAFVPTQQHKLVAPHFWDSCSWNSCSTRLQHRPQQPWGWYCNRFPGKNGYILQSFLLQNCAKCKVPPYLMGYKQVSTLILKWPLLKKISKCPRDAAQYSVKSPSWKASKLVFWFFSCNIALVCSCITDLDLSCRKQI